MGGGLLGSSGGGRSWYRLAWSWGNSEGSGGGGGGGEGIVARRRTHGVSKGAAVRTKARRCEQRTPPFVRVESSVCGRRERSRMDQLVIAAARDGSSKGQQCETRGNGSRYSLAPLFIGAAIHWRRYLLDVLSDSLIRRGWLRSRRTTERTSASRSPAYIKRIT